MSLNLILDNIYSHLDTQTKTNLALVSPELHSWIQETQKFFKISVQLLNDYEVYAHSFPERPLWYAIKKSHFFLVGNDHTKPEHAKIFAHFVNAIWVKDKFSLLLEMPTSESADLAILLKGELKYVDREIAANCKGWDATTTEINTLMANSYNAIFTTLKLYLLAQDENHEERSLKTVENLIATLKKIMNTDTQWETTEAYIKQMQVLRSVMKPADPSCKYQCNFKFRKAFVMLDLAIKIHKISRDFNDAIDKIVVDYAPKRDASMLKQLEIEKSQGKITILYAGLKHVSECPEYQVIQIFKKRRESFVVLHPKTHNSIHTNTESSAADISLEKGLLSEGFSFAAAREQIKSYSASKISSFDDLYLYIATEPFALIKHEIQKCLQEYDATMRDYDIHWKS